MVNIKKIKSDVVSIENNELILDNQERLEFDKLILATGYNSSDSEIKYDPVMCGHRVFLCKTDCSLSTLGIMRAEITSSAVCEYMIKNDETVNFDEYVKQFCKSNFQKLIMFHGKTLLSSGETYYVDDYIGDKWLLFWNFFIFVFMSVGMFFLYGAVMRSIRSSK